MRILVLTINYVPEKTGIGPFVAGLCEHMASESHEVSVVTAFPYYPEWRVWDGYRGKICRRESINKVNVLRVWHFVPKRASRLLQRVTHDISFSIAAFVGALFTGRFDVIYCLCPPPTLALAAYLLGKLRGKAYVIKLSDLASDAGLSTGIMKSGFALRMAQIIEKFAYRHAEKIICLCQGFIDKLRERGVPADKLQIIPDWADTERIYPVTGANAFRRNHDLCESDFVLAHTGNIGTKQGLMNVVRAAQLSRHERCMMWLLVGHGEEEKQIRREIQLLRLDNIKLLPLQPVAALAEMYASADVLLLNQRAAVQDAVIPSKLLTYMAAGRVVIGAVSEKSEAAQLIARAQCGLLTLAEDPQALVDAALRLMGDEALRKRLGKNGRAYAESHFTKKQVLKDYRNLFSLFAGNGDANAEVASEIVTLG